VLASVALLPLVVAVLGVLGTVVGGVSGVVITQRWSDRREARTAERERQREQERWERERQRERERWPREDAAQTFDLRRESYIAFFVAAALHRRNLVRFTFRDLLDVEDRPSLDDVGAIRMAQEKVRIYGSPAVRAAADDHRNHLAVALGYVVSESEDTETICRRARSLEIVDESEKSLLEVMRDELGIPVGAIEREAGGG
jgi:hypothetical protein